MEYLPTNTTNFILVPIQTTWYILIDSLAIMSKSLELVTCVLSNL